MIKQSKTEKKVVPAGRLNLGAFVLVVGFLTPLLIPLVLKMGWSPGVTSIVSGLLAFGIPELFMIIAIAIMGKEGYNYLKRLFSIIIRRYGPPDEVSLLRYRIGLFMFILPLVLSILAPYIGDKIEFYAHHKTIIMVILHVVLILSLFVLGGDFWEKLRGLFIRRAKIDMQSLSK